MIGSPLMMRYQFIEDWNMVVPSGKDIDIEVKRTWRERIFSLPWRPWQKTEVIQRPEMIPNPSYYQVGNTIIGHPQSIRRLKELMSD